MKNIEMLAAIAKGLGHLKDKVVFVGGSTVSLYLNDPATPAVRPTEDVDCLIEILTRAQYYKLEEELEKLGFTHAMEANNPICRWKYHGLTVDIMPTEGEVLNFTNRWYAEGYVNSRFVPLPDGEKVRVFTLPYFLASKIEAFLGRGREDFLTSPDMEDILAILDGADGIVEEITGASNNVRRYLSARFSEFLKDERFLESLEANLVSQAGTAGRVERVKSILKML